MKFIYSLIILLCCNTLTFGQTTLDATLKKLNTESIPYTYVSEVKTDSDVIILDTRKKEEYEVSHIKNSVWVGYEGFRTQNVINKIPNSDTEIVVYCSIGVRSEDIGEKLKKAGYTNVKNLYGGIFEWKNQGKSVFKTNSVETDSIHTYNKQWSKLLSKGIKVY